MGIKKDIKNPDIEIKIKGLALGGIYFALSIICVFLTIFVHKTFVILMFAFQTLLIVELSKKEEKGKKNDTMDTNTNNNRSNTRSSMARNGNGNRKISMEKHSQKKDGQDTTSYEENNETNWRRWQKKNT